MAVLCLLGASILPSPELGTLSSSKSKSHSAFGQFMTVEGFMEELKLLVSLCYRKRCLFWLMTQPWPLLSDVSSHPRQPSTFGCGLRFRSEPLDIGRESFAPISCLALKELTLTLFTVAHDTTHGNKEEMLGNMRLDQCSPKCSFLAKRCSKS